MRVVHEAADPPSSVSAEIRQPGRWTRRLRRVRARPLADPLGQSVLALTSALLAGGLGVWLLASGQHGRALVTLAATAVSVAVYTALGVRAFKRDKAVRYWKDCRDLRRDLTRRDAHLRLRWSMLTRVQRMGRSGARPGEAHAALAALVDGTYEVLDKTTGDDIAVVVALEANRRYRVLHAAASRRSRWAALAPGKRCPAEGSPEETLARLARHHRALGIDTPHGRLRMVVLSAVPLDEADHALCDELPLYLMLIAERWAPVGVPTELALAR